MNPEIRQKIKGIIDKLWAGGLSDPITYIVQLSYLIYLKMLDDEESRRQHRIRATGKGQSLFPQQASRFRWKEWRFKNGDELVKFIRDDVFPYMASLVEAEPRIAEYFRDATLEIQDPVLLKDVIDELDGIPFAKLPPDTKGDIFEYMLTHIKQASLNGQFRTPRQIRMMMVEMVDPDFHDTVFDPACGTGGFLIDAVEYVLAKYSETPTELPIYGEDWMESTGKTIEELKQANPRLQTYRHGPGEKLPDWSILENSIFGVDVSRQLMRISMMNLVLHGLQNANVKRGNTLSEYGGLTEEDLRRKYKVILSNPPFAGTIPKDSMRADLPTNSKKSELLFLSVMMQSLAPGGACAVVVPEGLLFGSTKSHVELRKKLVEEFNVRAVISLPAGVFKPYAGVKTSVILFTKPIDHRKSTIDNARVWFYELKNDGYDPEKITGGLRAETPGQNEIPAMLVEWKRYKASGFKTPPGVEGKSLLAPGSDNPKSWWVPNTALADEEFNLSATRYKPQVGEKPPDDDPCELIEQTLKLERDIVNGLENLLKDVGDAG
jgi:type I restriction enzyme M protein